MTTNISTIIMLVTTLGVTVTVLTTIWIINQSLRKEMREGFEAVDKKIDTLNTEMINENKKIEGEIVRLSERMASLEGTMYGLHTALSGFAGRPVT